MYQKVKSVKYVTQLPSEDGEIPVESIQETVSPIPMIRTHYNSRFYAKNQELNTMPSLTVPDEAMSVQELVKRFASGLPISGGRIPMYEDVDELELTDQQRLDLSERDAIIRERQEELIEIDKRIRERRLKAEEIRLEKMIRERLEKKAEENPIPNPNPQP